MLLVRGVGRVLGDLAALGYDCRWTCLSAADCGAPHKRDRIWILGWYSNCHDDCAQREIPQKDSNSGRACAEYSDATGERCGEAWELLRDESEEWPCRLRASNSDAERDGLEMFNQAGPASRATHRSGDERDSCGWPTEPGVGRVADGVADWKHRIFALGNGQVPRVHAAAWRILTQPFHTNPTPTPHCARKPLKRNDYFSSPCFSLE